MVSELVYAKCPNCGSANVCWNWFHVCGGEREKYEQMNPHIPPEELLDWGHECWDCGNCFETKDKVLNGLPYELLVRLASEDYKEIRREITKEFVAWLEEHSSSPRYVGKTVRYEAHYTQEEYFALLKEAGEEDETDRSSEKAA